MTRRIGLIFHGIGTPRRTLDPGEAAYWISNEQYLQVLDLVAASPDPGLFRLSFDDGNASDVEIGLPGLLERGLRADFFVLAGRIGKAGSLDGEAIRSLQGAGMAIGSHGVAHVDWRGLDGEGLRQELHGSRQAISEVCGCDVVTAGIPFGAYNRRVLTGLAAAGYRCAFSSDRGSMDDGAFLRPRTSVRGAMTGAEIGAVLTGALPVAASLRRAIGMARRRWL